jgi:hypothetical protein
MAVVNQESSALPVELYIQKNKIVYTMSKSQSNSKSKKKKVLPIKLEPEVYQDLKFVSQQTDQSMAAIIRSHFVKPVQEQAKKIKEKRKMSLYEYFQNNVWTGPIAYPDKTDDEVAYLIGNGLGTEYEE